MSETKQEDWRLTAPWTEEDTRLLNLYQKIGPPAYPYKCGSAGCKEKLRAFQDGWTCPKCGYRQDWAHRDSVAFARRKEKV